MDTWTRTYYKNLIIPFIALAVIGLFAPNWTFWPLMAAYVGFVVRASRVASRAERAERKR